MFCNLILKNKSCAVILSLFYSDLFSPKTISYTLIFKRTWRELHLESNRPSSQLFGKKTNIFLHLFFKGNKRENKNIFRQLPYRTMCECWKSLYLTNIFQETEISWKEFECSQVTEMAGSDVLFFLTMLFLCADGNMKSWLHLKFETWKLLYSIEYKCLVLMP